MTEWAEVTNLELLTPDGLAELDEDDNSTGSWALVSFTGSDGCVLVGTLDEIETTLHGLLSDVYEAQGIRVEDEKTDHNGGPREP